MRRPWGMYTDRMTKPGRTLLRAGNVIDSIGDGPAELFGTPHRSALHARPPAHLHAQAAGASAWPRTGGSSSSSPTSSRFWWKFYNAARFELWRVDARGKRTRLVRTGPKVAYCLRDLERTRPALPRSPRIAALPGVQQQLERRSR